MTLMRQVLRDLVKDAGWVVFYGFLTAMSIMAFVLVGLSYRHVASQNDAIRRFTQNDVSMVQVKDLSGLRTAADREAAAQLAGTGRERQQGLAELFRKHDNLGSLVFLPGSGGYQQTIVYVGAYTRLTAFPFPAGSDAPIAAVSPDCAGDEGKTLRIGDHECIVTVVPADMDVYHPLYYIPPASENLKKTLYVFSPSFEDALSLAAFPQLSVNLFIDRLILAEPTQESAADVRSFLYQNYSAYAEIQSTENFLRLSAASGTRTHQTYLLFYIMSTLVLFGALLLNTYRILRRRIPEYAVHHLFGAPQRFIFARMYLFVLGYHVIPLAGTLLILSLNRLASPLNLLMVFAAAMGSALLVTGIVQRRFAAEFSQSLRRE